MSADRRHLIALRCECGNAQLTERETYEPSDAVETLTSQCPVCDDGDFGTETHIDRQGREIPFHAQGIEALGQDPKGLDAEHESPTPQGMRPNLPLPPASRPRTVEAEMPLITETHREEARRVVGSISFLLPDSIAWRNRVEAAIATALATAHQSGRDAALEEAAKVAGDYAARMTTAASKPHPITGKHNLIAECKADAGESIATAIRSLKTEGPK